MTFETNTRSRKWFLTINNPLDKGFTHDKIKEIIDNNINNDYYCLCDEIGLEEQTPHTHIFISCENAISFKRIKKLLYEANIQKALGTCQQCKDYIRKEGKYLNSDKEDTNIKETFEEFGIMPLDTKEKNKKQSEMVLEMIKAGASDIEIIEACPSYMNKLPCISQIRNKYREEEQEIYHKRHVEFIYGETGTGKTRSVYQRYNREDVCRASNYKNPFDNYNGQHVLVLDEFRGQLEFSDMLMLLDGYSTYLPARYSDKLALFDTIIIISNRSLDEIYKDIQYSHPKDWQAFLRRIDNILEFKINDGSRVDIPLDEPIVIEHFKNEYM